MIYIYLGEHTNIIKKKVNLLINSLCIDNIIKYDASECSFDDVLDEVSYTDLFNEKKLVIVSYLSFKKITEKEEKRFIAYMHSNEAKENALIIKCIDESLDERKKLTKQIKENTNLDITAKLSAYDLHKYVTDLFKEENINITQNQIWKILKLCKNNVDITINEIDKLLLYLDGRKDISDEIIDKVISINNEKEIYTLISNVLKKDIKGCLNSYKILIESKIDVTVIVDAIAKKMRNIYQIKYLFGKMSDKDLIRKLDIREFEIKDMLEYARSHNDKDMLDMMYKLSEVDEKVKSYNIDKNKVMEMFFINL